MIDRSFIGYTTAPSRVRVDAWRVRLFHQAIGEGASEPVPAVGDVIPPTFLKALEGEHFGSAALLNVLKVPVRSVLHAEQRFDYFAPVRVGDEVEISRTVTDLYDKRDGALSFIVVQTRYGVGGAEAATSTQTILVRNQRDARP